jgi:phosphoribosylformylglycinamidine synthase
LRVGGTNCDAETKRAFDILGANAEVIHINKIVRNKNLLDYNILVIPGGFSYGDYIRAGAILGKQLKIKLENYMKKFVEDGRPVLGICNGFQILIESGFLPAINGVAEYPEAVLANNSSAKFECRWTYIKNQNSSNCVFTSKIPKGSLLRMPIAIGEGRFIVPDNVLDKLIENGQIVFQYTKPDGELANGKYPWNPNGGMKDIAAICNPEGNVFAMIPHPERAFLRIQYPDWTSNQDGEYGDGKFIFDSVIEYIIKNF